MVLTIKNAANAAYYFQDIAHAGDKARARGVWLHGARDLDDSKAKGQEKRLQLLGVQRGETVDKNDLDSLLHRKTARTGEMPIFSLKPTTSGYDFVFSAPKSLSILWAIAPSDEATAPVDRARIERAHHTAVEAATAVLLQEAIRERVGKGGRELRAADAAIAGFLHFRCRLAAHQVSKDDRKKDDLFPDPNLHSHVLVPDLVVSSLVKQAKGKANIPSTSRTLKVPYTALYRRWSMALGAWYHATLAFELRQLGLALRPSGPNGLFALEGCKTEWTIGFSARTQGAKHLHPELSKARALAATKKRADEFMTADYVERAWERHATRLKVTKSIGAASSNASAPTIVAELTRRELDAIVTSLAEQEAVLQKQDIFRAVASYLVAEGIHARPTIDLVNGVIAQLEPLPASDSYALPQWTTPAYFEREKEVERIAARFAHRPFPAIDVEPALKAAALPFDPAQMDAIRQIAQSHRLVVIEGGPGTGKTALLPPLVDTYRKAFKNGSVICAAEAWLQALQLGSKLQIDEPLSLQSLISRIARKQIELGGRKTVIIIDEAGLIPMERMREILRLVERFDVKLILLGDSEQLDPLGAGSSFRLVAKSGHVCHLEAIKRQRPGPLLDIATRLSTIANARRKAADRVDIAQNRNVVREELAATAADLLVNRVWTTFGASDDAIKAIVARLLTQMEQQGPDRPPLRALMRSHREAQHLMRRMRSAMREAKLLEDEEIILPAVTPMGGGYTLRLSVGDRVRFLTRNVTLNVFNGTEGRVTAIDDVSLGMDATMTVEVSDTSGKRSVDFKPKDLTLDGDPRVRLACAYAMTIYGSQGQTFDDVLILRSSRMSMRELMVAVTRASDRFEIFEVDGARRRLWEQAAASPVPGSSELPSLPPDNPWRRLHASIALDLTKAERADHRKSITDDVMKQANTTRPEPQPWEWHVMVEGELTDHRPGVFRSIEGQASVEGSVSVYP
jgi:conjugative relaxase-like TrwC/TraI family protein